jgi:hypothetical protein
MDEQMNLKNITVEVSTIIDNLKVGRNTTDFPVKWENAQKRLVEIQRLLRNYSVICNHNLGILEGTSSAGLQKAAQISGNEITKIKRIISRIDSAISRYASTLQKADRLHRTGLDNFSGDFETNTGIMNKSEGEDHLQVTYQTIALIDAERYGIAAGSETIEKYPRPDLGQLSGQRNCGIADKIRMGSPNSTPSANSDYRITIPQSCRNFHGGNF